MAAPCRTLHGRGHRPATVATSRECRRRPRRGGLMGAALGLLLGIGLLLIWESRAGRPARASSRPRGLTERTRDLLAQAGCTAWRPAQLWTLCAASGVFG